MSHSQLPYEAAAIIQKRVPNFKPDIGIILGSGLGSFADENIENASIIPFEDLPGFGHTEVKGHESRMILGTLHGVKVVCMQGRKHYYEGISNDVMCGVYRTLKLLGCKLMLATNAVGSMRTETKPGELVVLKDHINFLFSNPLVGDNDDNFGPRFVPMADAYDPELRQRLLRLATELDIKLTEGVLVATLGPTYETPAEIQAFRIMGADVAGMSTVPEVIVARHCGMKVAVISAVTNMASGMSEGVDLGHEEVVRVANIVAKDLARLILAFVDDLKADVGSGKL